MSCSTIFSLFWDNMFEALPGAYMGGLRHSNGAAIATWIYCIIWFLVQDVCKVAAYGLWDAYMLDPKKKAIETFARRHSLELRELVNSTGAGGHGHGQAAAPGTTGEELLPMGVDLTQIALDAATESVRLRNLASVAKAKEEAHGGRGRLAEIAAGRAPSAKATPAASEAAEATIPEASPEAVVVVPVVKSAPASPAQ
jgi:hypothetical protein